ncbi:MAG TPA: hypothetical protein VJ779_03530 [Acetobacteraceae bacterium]|nr:hypothetical protein [Acetobacteraceae bacterium]
MLDRFPRAALMLLALSPTLAGCGSFLSATTGDVAGIASAGIASAVTKSPAVATGIGLGIGSGANAGLGYVERRVHRTEQDQIAAAAGPLAPGQVASWRVVHRVPIEPDEHGEVTVTGETGGTGVQCKAIVFSVAHEQDGKLDPAFYTASVCGQGGTWHWASAEPATERWGALQ